MASDKMELDETSDETCIFRKKQKAEKCEELDEWGRYFEHSDLKRKTPKPRNPSVAESQTSSSCDEKENVAAMSEPMESSKCYCGLIIDFSDVGVDPATEQAFNDYFDNPNRKRKIPKRRDMN